MTSKLFLNLVAVFAILFTAGMACKCPCSGG